MIKIINDDSINQSITCDMIFTDPFYDMKSSKVVEILNKNQFNHLIIIATMRQIIEICGFLDMDICFDFVMDVKTPGKPKNYQMPHYTHRNCVYLKKKGVKSAFNRKLDCRTDVYSNNGYWPTVFNAPLDQSEFGYAKNIEAIKNILRCFDVDTIYDPFGGSGSTAIASHELRKDCILCELSTETFEILKNNLDFNGISYEEHN